MKDSVGTQDPPYDSLYAIAETGYHDPPGAGRSGDPYQLQCRFYLTAAKPPHTRFGLVHRRVQIGYLPSTRLASLSPGGARSRRPLSAAT